MEQPITVGMEDNTKTMSDHTPGPWVLSRRGHHWEVTEVTESGTLAISIPLLSKSRARLVRAAPELLAALARLAAALARDGCPAQPPETQMALHEANKAIAKAKDGAS